MQSKLSRTAYVLVCALAVFAAAPALADDVHVIETGRESDVLALLAPFELGSDVEGWTIESVSIEATSIDVTLVGADGANGADGSAHLILVHVSEDDVRTPSASFGFRHAEAAEARRAIDRLIEAINENDDGNFWRVEATADPGPSFGGSGLDGVVLAFVFLFFLVVVAFRMAERRWLLALIALSGIGLRFWVSPRTMLGAWFYSRTTPIQRVIEESGSLRYLNLKLGGEWAEIDILLVIGFVFAAVTPLALFLHARLLLGDERRALFAAAIVAVLPVHLRFSASEVAFIPSIVFSSSLFAAAHGVMKGNKRVALIGALALVPMSIATLYARPLNMLFVVLLAIYVGFVEKTASRPRRLIAAIVPALCAIPITAIHLVEQYGDNLREGASLTVVADAFALVFDLEKNTLINLSITPLALIFMIVGGLVLFLRTPKSERSDLEQRRYLFLFLWLGAFFVTHAYVVPASAAVQARYHLHLVVPVVFMAAMGFELLQQASRKGGVVLGIIMLASPAVHLGFITDLEYNDLAELSFVRQVQSVIPEGCELVEYAPTDMDARFRRGGLVLADGNFSLPYTLVVQRPEQALVIGEATGCRLVYEGLSCLSEKERSEQIAPECGALLRSGSMSPVESVSFTSRVYDGNLARGFNPGTERIQLTLYRAE
ncbi:MAG: hypothetical protein AB8H86_30020 [Polyangiales bacterium]